MLSSQLNQQECRNNHARCGRDIDFSPTPKASFVNLLSWHLAEWGCSISLQKMMHSQKFHSVNFKWARNTPKKSVISKYSKSFKDFSVSLIKCTMSKNHSKCLNYYQNVDFLSEKFKYCQNEPFWQIWIFGGKNSITVEIRLFWRIFKHRVSYRPHVIPFWKENYSRLIILFWFCLLVSSSFQAVLLFYFSNCWQSSIIGHHHHHFCWNIWEENLPFKWSVFSRDF